MLSMMLSILLLLVPAEPASLPSYPDYSLKLKPSQRLSVALWPTPAGPVTHGATTIIVDAAKFTFTVGGAGGRSPTLAAAIKRYTGAPGNPGGIIFLHGAGNASRDSSSSNTLHSCSVTVVSSEETLSLGMDESYTLEGSDDASCAITAPTFVGAVYAMETLSQLVLSDGGALGGDAPAAYWIPQAPWSISDKPRFPYRGLMVDTSRHWLPLNALRRQIDGLVTNKMNVLHWHLTE